MISSPVDCRVSMSGNRPFFTGGRRMHSKIDIINLALANLSNGNMVQDLSENTPEAAQAAAHWDVVVDSLLAEYPWAFATRTESLACLGHEGTDYAWAYPDDCTRILRICAAGTNTPESFTILRSRDNRKRMIMAAAPTAVATYITRDVPASDMPAHFVNALAWKLAAELALAKRADPSLATACLQAYEVYLEQAKLRDAREAGPHPRRPGKWLRVRNV